MHRDIKGANLLVSSKGEVKLADFGLAREVTPNFKNYTNRVVTLWYRAPELLLGTKNYSYPIDMWSVGCLFGELLANNPLFPGDTEHKQLHCIFSMLGFPTEERLPGVTKMRIFSKLTNKPIYKYKLKDYISNDSSKADELAVDLLEKMLLYDPSKRITAAEALNHPYFHSEPLPCKPSELPQSAVDAHAFKVRQDRLINNPDIQRAQKNHKSKAFKHKHNEEQHFQESKPQFQEGQGFERKRNHQEGVFKAPTKVFARTSKDGISPVPIASLNQREETKGAHANLKRLQKEVSSALEPSFKVPASIPSQDRENVGKGTMDPATGVAEIAESRK